MDFDTTNLAPIGAIGIAIIAALRWMFSEKAWASIIQELRTDNAALRATLHETQSDLEVASKALQECRNNDAERISKIAEVSIENTSLRRQLHRYTIREFFPRESQELEKEENT